MDRQIIAKSQYFKVRDRIYNVIKEGGEYFITVFHNNRDYYLGRSYKTRNGAIRCYENCVQHENEIEESGSVHPVSRIFTK